VIQDMRSGSWFSKVPLPSFSDALETDELIKATNRQNPDLAQYTTTGTLNAKLR